MTIKIDALKLDVCSKINLKQYKNRVAVKSIKIACVPKSMHVTFSFASSRYAKTRPSKSRKVVQQQTEGIIRTSLEMDTDTVRIKY